MPIIAVVEKWLWDRAAKKALRAGVITALSFVAAKKGLLDSWGVGLNLDPDLLAAALAAGLHSGVDFVRNWFKHRKE